MKISATPDTVRAVTQVFKLAGILDDRAAQPDKARVIAWAEQVQRHNLTESDLLDGLQSYYDLPNDRAIQVGDLIHHARIAKRARLDREQDELYRQLEARSDAKAAEDIREITAEAIIGRIKNRTPRLEAATAALQNCRGRRESAEAIVEYFAARAEAGKRKPKRRKEKAS